MNWYKLAMEQFDLAPYGNSSGATTYMDIGHVGYVQESQDYAKHIKQHRLQQYLYVWTPETGLHIESITPKNSQSGHFNLFRQIQNKYTASDKCYYIGRVDNKGQNNQHRATISTSIDCRPHRQYRDAVKKVLTQKFGPTEFWIN